MDANRYKSNVVSIQDKTEDKRRNNETKLQCNMYHVIL